MAILKKTENYGSIENFMMDSLEVSKSYRLYKRRWLFLGTVAFMNMTCMAIGVSFAPAATIVTKYYEISGDQIDMIPMAAWGINLLGIFFGIYMIGRFKMLIAIRYASVATLIGGLVRAFSTISDSVDRQTQFWITFVGQVIIALGHPIIIVMSTKTSQVWFGERERAISTPLLALAPTLGGVIGQVIPLVILNNNPENVRILNIVTACPLLLTTISSFVLLKSAEPPTPPSGSAEKLLNEKPKTLKELILTMLSFAKNATVVIIILIEGTGGGMLQVFLTQLNQLMCSTNYEKSQSTFIAMINIVCGLVGAFVINVLAKRWKLQIEFGKISFGIASVSNIIMMMGMKTYDKLWWIALGFSGFGFFGYAAFPLMLELAVEETYPIDASLSEACIHMAVQVAAIAGTLLCNNMNTKLDPRYPNKCESEDNIGVVAKDYSSFYYLIMVSSTVLAIAMILIMKPSMKRSQEDDKLRKSNLKESVNVSEEQSTTTEKARAKVENLEI